MRFAFLFVFVLGAFHSFGNDWLVSDSSRANHHYALGDSLLLANQFDDALGYFRKAALVFQRQGNREKYITCLNKTTEALLRLNQLEESKNQALKALNLVTKYLGENNTQRAISLSNMGTYYFKSHQFPEALSHYQNALKILKQKLEPEYEEIARILYKIGEWYRNKDDYDTALYYYQQSKNRVINVFGENHHMIATCYNSIGVTYLMKNLHDKAIHYFRKSYDTYVSVFGENYLWAANSLANMGIAYRHKGSYGQALECQEKALSIKKQILEKTDVWLGYSYGNLGALHQDMGSFELALEYQLKQLKIQKAVFGEVHPNLARVYNNLAGTYYYKKDFQRALEFNFKALKIRKAVYGEHNLKVAKSYNNLGIDYIELGQYTKALHYLQEALKIRKKILGSSHRFISSTLNNMGGLYEAQNQYDLAIKYYKKSLIIRYQIYGPKHPLVASLHRRVAQANMKKQEFKKALYHSQQAVMANLTYVSDSSLFNNLSLENYLDQNELIKALHTKARACFHLYQNTDSLDYLWLSYSTSLSCDTLINKIRRSYKRYTDKVARGQIFHEIYLTGITACEKLWQVTDSIFYLKKAFYYSEKNKAAILSESLTSRQAKLFGGIPKHLLQTEENLIRERDRSYAKAQEMRAGKNGYDSFKLEQEEEKLLSLNGKLDSLQLALEEHHPRYYQLKYGNSVIGVPQLQSKLHENQAILSYSEDDSTVYVMVVTPSDFQLKKINKDTAFQTSLNTFISSLSQSSINDFPVQSYENYLSSAHQLYQQLMAPITTSVPKKINHLIVAPFGSFSTAPWGLMLQSLPRDAKKPNYRTLNYLFRDYSISYAHSASLLFQDLYQNNKEHISNFLGFAPTYKDEEYGYEPLSEQFRDKITPLEWNDQEIQAINQHLQGTLVLGQQATEKAFKKLAGNYQILHLAMHAFVDGENPMESKLIFSQDNDSIEDNMLNTYELFNMNLSAELAVLSACKTGVGKLQNGEGVMSLGRAFSYAGCPSVVMSHWAVDDQSTFQFMNHFYKALSEGKSKDKAMRQARINFLKNPPPGKQHPAYWGGFVVLGDTSPLNTSGNGWLYWLMGGCIALVTVSFKLFRRRS